MNRRALLGGVGLLVLVVLVVGGLTLRRRRQAELANVAPPVLAPWAVRVASLTRGRVTRGFPALALLRGENEVALSPRLGAVILELGPRAGQRVDRGDLLARLDTQELTEQLASLEAQRLAAVSDAERRVRDARRAEELLASKILSKSEADERQATARSAQEQVRSLENQLAAARTRLGYARLTAPFAGVISERLADPGELAAVGKPIYRLVSTDSGRLEVRLPAEVLEQVEPGSEVVVSHGGELLRLRATRVLPSLDQRSLGRLEVDLPTLPVGAVPGALLGARVVTDAVDDVLIVPPDAILAGEGATGRVLKLAGDAPDRVVAVPVTVRLRGREGVAVDGALQVGDRVVTAHESTLRRLRDGDPVRIERDDR